MISHVTRRLSAVCPRGAGLVAIVVLSLGLTGCYTQLQLADEDPDAEGPRAEPSARERAPTDASTDRHSATRFDPAAPLASLRRANPKSRGELVSLARDLQAARAYTKISFTEYREGVRFFQTNHPDFYGNYFGDPLYATYDLQYEQTAQAALAASRDLHPENSFWQIDGFFCAPHGYDPAFGCRGWSYAPSDFFFLPESLAFRGAGRFGPAGVAPRPSGLSSLYAWLWGYSYAASGYGFGGWGSSSYVSDHTSSLVFDSGRQANRDAEPRGGTIGRGETSADPAADRTGQRASSRARDRAGRASEERSPAGRAPGAALRTGALASIGDVTLEPVRVPVPDVEGASRAEKLRIFRAMKRIAEETGNGPLSIEQRNEIAEEIQRLVRAQEKDLSALQDGRSRARTPDAPDSWRGGQEASGRLGTHVGRGSSGSNRGAPRSGSRDRSGSGDSGRDRSRSGSGDDGGRR